MSTVVANQEMAAVISPHPPQKHQEVLQGESPDAIPLEVLEGRLPELRTGSVAVLDNTMPLPTSNQSDFLPEDVLFALTQAVPARDVLGPISRTRNLNTSTTQVRKNPSNVWSYKRKERFKHLTENIPCICGAGRDISFLYDVPKSDNKVDKPEKIDKSVIRKEVTDQPTQVLKLPDTLVPEEYHVVKNKAVMGLEFHEDKYTAQPEDHEKHLVVFPSMKPNSRFEVLQLRKTMELMLERAGVSDVDVEIKGPTQMHNLLGLIKKEQNIYNIVFHELIRQTSVECVERGELLAELRSRYNDLINSVPQQIKSLHEEVNAQRALDRRLTEELMRFKATISNLTSELTKVKEHDRIVTHQAQRAQEELRVTLLEAEKHASQQREDYELYELQRRRREQEVLNLASERDQWSSAAYKLALKIAEESQISNAKRLQVSEKSWTELARHFTTILCDKDSKLLENIQEHVQTWCRLVKELNIEIQHREEDMQIHLKPLSAEFGHWMKIIRDICFTKEGHFIKPPKEEKMRDFLKDIKRWQEILGKETDKFAGDILLSDRERLNKIEHETEGWTENANRVFSRHFGQSGKLHSDQKNLNKLNEQIADVIRQINNRTTGENGVASNLIHLRNSLEAWDMRIVAVLNGTLVVPDSEWSSLAHQMEEWISTAREAIDFIGTTQREESRMEGKPHTSIDIHDIQRKIQEWVKTSTNTIDSKDGILVEQVTTLRSSMVRWMVQILLQLAPNRADTSKEASDSALIGSWTIGELQAHAKTLFDQLDDFSKNVSGCCDGIVRDNTQERRDNMEEDAEYELRNLEKLTEECECWVSTAKVLLCQLTGESVEVLFPGSSILLKSSEVLETLEVKPTQPDTDKTDADQQQPADTGEHVQETIETATIEQTASSEPEKQVSAEISTLSQDSQAEDKQEKHVTIQEPEGKEEWEGEQLEKLEVIGIDDNTHVTALDQSESPEPPSLMIPAQGPHDESKDAMKALEALAAVDALRKQLLTTEMRAQEAEEKAAMSDSKLAEYEEKIRALEKKLEKSEEESTKDETESVKSARLSEPSPAPSSPSKERSDVEKKDKKRPESRSTSKIKKKK
ncbi:hypothetical protein ScPMuIL_010412 [Solemya velum]